MVWVSVVELYSSYAEATRRYGPCGCSIMFSRWGDWGEGGVCVSLDWGTWCRARYRGSVSVISLGCVPRLAISSWVIRYRDVDVDSEVATTTMPGEWGDGLPLYMD